jgi:hypothetical protein
MFDQISISRWNRRSNAEVAHHAAEGDADQVGQRGEGGREQDRGPEAVEEPRENVAAGRVRAEVVAALDARRYCPQDAVVGVVLVRPEGHDRHDHPVAGAPGLEARLELAVVDRRARGLALEPELAAEPHRRVGREGPLALVADREGPVVDQQLGEQRQDRQADEEPERVVAALQGAEAAQLAQGERVQPHVNLTRGSTKATRMSDRMLPMSSRKLDSSTTPITIG